MNREQDGGLVRWAAVFKGPTFIYTPPNLHVRAHAELV